MMWHWLGTLEQRKVDALFGQNAPAAAHEHIGWAEMAYRRCVGLGYRRPAAYFNLRGCTLAPNSPPGDQDD
jgi:hypothetical protein